MNLIMMPLKFRLLFEGNGPLDHLMKALEDSSDLSRLKKWIKFNLPPDIKWGSVSEADDRILVLFNRALDYRVALRAQAMLSERQREVVSPSMSEVDNELPWHSDFQEDKEITELRKWVANPTLI